MGQTVPESIEVCEAAVCQCWDGWLGGGWEGGELWRVVCVARSTLCGIFVYYFYAVIVVQYFLTVNLCCIFVPYFCAVVLRGILVQYVRHSGAVFLCNSMVQYLWAIACAVFSVQYSCTATVLRCARMAAWCSLCSSLDCCTCKRAWEKSRRAETTAARTATCCSECHSDGPL